jgi:hypothetical protein
MPDVRSVTYCSYAVPGKCLGILILEGELDVIEAAKEAHRLKLSPGGSLLAVSCKETDGDLPPGAFEAMWANRNRLIPDVEARVLFDGASVEEWDGSTTPN